jgi:hypothetical protein
MQASTTPPKPKLRPRPAESQRVIESMSADQLNEMASNLQTLRQQSHDPSIDELVGQADEKLAAHRAHLEAIDGRLAEINAAVGSRTRNARQAAADAHATEVEAAKESLTRELQVYLAHIERANEGARALREGLMEAIASMERMTPLARTATEVTGLTSNLSALNPLYCERRLGYRLTHILRGLVPRNPMRFGYVQLPSIPNNQDGEADWRKAEEAKLRREIFDMLFAEGAEA